MTDRYHLHTFDYVGTQLRGSKAGERAVKISCNVSIGPFFFFFLDAIVRYLPQKSTHGCAGRRDDIYRGE